VTRDAERPSALDASVDQLERFRPGLLLIALRRLGSSEAAEEAVQETLTRAVVALRDGRFTGPDHLPAFVSGIARHVIVDVLRANRRLASLEGVPERLHPQDSANALDALVTAAERAHLHTALALLEPADRDLLYLCYFEGLTPNEIATRLREPSERVRKRKSRALQRLRLAFRGESGHAESSSATNRSDHER
jgi:RNA polymerase sigma-70 factor (ECF subfamily)